MRFIMNFTVDIKLFFSFIFNMSYSCSNTSSLQLGPFTIQSAIYGHSAATSAPRVIAINITAMKRQLQADTIIRLKARRIENFSYAYLQKHARA